MRFLSHLIAFYALIATAIASQMPMRASFPQGIDVSHYQGTINWAEVASKGVVFVYIKATEGTCTCLKH
jgi:GH25 family lysozyme M1 (1,4-beta-N-acetylmuramidase)